MNGHERVKQIGLWLDSQELTDLQYIPEYLESTVPGVKITDQAAIRYAIRELADRMEQKAVQHDERP